MSLMVSEVVDEILRMDAAELKRSVVPPSLLHDGPIKEAVEIRSYVWMLLSLSGRVRCPHHYSMMV